MLFTNSVLEMTDNKIFTIITVIAIVENFSPLNIEYFFVFIFELNILNIKIDINYYIQIYI